MLYVFTNINLSKIKLCLIHENPLKPTFQNKFFAKSQYENFKRYLKNKKHEIKTIRNLKRN